LHHLVAGKVNEKPDMRDMRQRENVIVPMDAIRVSMRQAKRLFVI